MKITVIVRTRNEERNISKFCRAYSWADNIVVSDGGSKDATVALARTFNNVIIDRFSKKVTRDNGRTWRNPHGLHINSMINIAEDLKSDWVIFDDCDCFPNYMVQRFGKKIFNNSCDVLNINRIYLFGKDKWFENITLPTGDFISSTSLYAWRANIGIRADESNPWEHNIFTQHKSQRNLPIPFCALHDYYPDDVVRKRKVKYYRASGEQPNCRDPLNYGGNKKAIEDWMRLE